MTLNGMMAVTLRYFIEFGKPAFRTTCSNIEHINQKSASITHRTVKLVCLTKFTIRGWTRSYRYIRYRFTLLTFNLSSKFHFTTMF